MSGGPQKQTSGRGTSTTMARSGRTTTPGIVSTTAPAPAPVPATAQVQASSSSTTTSSSTITTTPAPRFITSPNRFTNTTGVDINGYTFTLKDNLANGDCFFSAVYQSILKWDSLQSGALFQLLKACEPRFEVSKGENDFIQSCRDILADKILAGGLESIYNRYLELFFSSPESLPLMVREYQSYFQRIILNKLNKQLNPSNEFYTLDEFSKLIADEIRKSGTWVSELEVDLFRKILSDCNIQLDWYSDNSVMPSLLPKKYLTKFVINLHVIRGWHWQHYVLSGAPSTVRLRRLDHSFEVITHGGKEQTRKQKRKQNVKKRLNKSRKNK